VDEALNTSVLAGCLKGDRKSQELLYQQFYSYGMSICLRYTATREEASEVLNDSFMKVFQHLGQYDANKPFLGWFRRILINTAINYYKKHLKHHRVQDIDTAPPVPVTRDVISHLSYQEIIGLVQQLTPTYRTVFNLYVIDGYSHEEIARMLHISEGASKSNLSRARANLRNMLKKSHEEIHARYER
jgi:RNA polymerase sigma-70 factor (ECF subfamily)